ncbi:MAG TPA: hypothetical protein DEV93_22700, partial [Chloroflexi bacterium]|nr:hypothetical protein [Chloroflexota bacterium]
MSCRRSGATKTLPIWSRGSSPHPDRMFPREIVADRQAGTIDVTWDDGHRSLYTAEHLRWSCPCATCAGEWGRPGLLEGVEQLPPDEFRLADVR